MREKQRKIDKVIEHRRKIASMYKTLLKELNIEPPYEPSYAVHTYLKFPLLVKNRKKFFKDAEKEKIELGDWFISPIQKNFELWHYKYGENPIAFFFSFLQFGESKKLAEINKQIISPFSKL